MIDPASTKTIPVPLPANLLAAAAAGLVVWGFLFLLWFLALAGTL